MNNPAENYRVPAHNQTISSIGAVDFIYFVDKIFTVTRLDLFS
jgi:hypothetical protein